MPKWIWRRRPRCWPRGSFTAGKATTRRWQDDVAAMAKANSMDVLRIGVDDQQTTIALSEFIAERRLRKAA